MSNDQNGYDDKNRAFLQALIAASTLTVEEAKKVIAAILTAHNRDGTEPEDISSETVEDYIQAANDAVNSFDMEVRSTTHQITKQKIYAIINSTSDGVTQAATGFTPDEISYVKRVLDAIFITNNTLRHEVMAIQPIAATKLCKPPNRRDTQDGETQGSNSAAITSVQADKVCQTLVDQGWFERSRKNYYSLSPRALMELRGWLEETYNDEEDEDDEDARGLRIKQCHTCKEIVTYGQRCSKLECHTRFHDQCIDAFLRAQRNRECPGCKTIWTGEDFVGERADRKTNNTSRPSDTSQRRTQINGTATRRRTIQEGDDDMEE